MVSYSNYLSRPAALLMRISALIPSFQLKMWTGRNFMNIFPIEDYKIIEIYNVNI